MQAARLRLLAAADPLIARLIQIGQAAGKDSNVDAATSLAAIKEALNRMGFVAIEKSGGSSDGTVLWEEFIEIHRRRVPVTDD